MYISLVQMDSVIGDFERNGTKILGLAARAAAGWPAGPEGGLVVFPELALCGYPPMDLLDQDSFVEGSLAALRSLQKRLPPGIAVGVGYVDKNRRGSGRPLVNAYSFISGGRIVFTQEKTLLPTYDVFDEARYFEPAQSRQVFKFEGTKIGVAICEDMWWESPPSPGFKYAIDPVKELLDEGIDILLVPSASPFVAGKLATRLKLAAGSAKQGGIPVLYCNAVGANDSLVFDGRSFAIAPWGKPSAMCGWEEEILLVDTDRLAQGARIEVETGVQEIHRALVAGIRGYMEKCGFSKACLGLSGGIDSSLVAVLAAEAIGAENLTCITMPSRFSSDGSVNDSIELCRRAGIRLERLPIEAPFTAFLDLLSGPFAGREFDLAEENLQARIRGNILMAWSNKFGCLLLTTGNKSEIAAGYCTLYGDMCGAIAVIGDLYKTEVYALSRHLNALATARGESEPIPLAILEKVPSAELRFNQKDQDSLPEYELLDSVLRLYIEENQGYEQIVAKGFDPGLVEKVLRLTAGAEYKRRQAAPVIKVSRRAFGIGRRLPLARCSHEVPSSCR
ncbi:MAG: NAD+ synthase (glutamine-hydrolysing) [Spirochaetes bacterium]|nr:MAG: NAD+ synthase (glutamine-hydrolysing) [Spirochaetota bacterium]